MCIKEVIDDNWQGADGWAVAFDMDIYQGVNSWFEYDGLIWKYIQHQQLSWKTMLKQFLREKQWFSNGDPLPKAHY